MSEYVTSYFSSIKVISKSSAHITNWIMAKIQYTMFHSYVLLSVPFLFTVCSGVPLDGFFPFGESAGDLILPPNDDRFTSFELNFGFTFYNETYRTIFVSAYVCDYVCTVKYVCTTIMCYV